MTTKPTTPRSAAAPSGFSFARRSPRRWARLASLACALGLVAAMNAGQSTVGTTNLTHETNFVGGGQPSTVGTKILSRVGICGTYKHIRTVKGRWDLTAGVIVGNDTN